MTVTNSSHLPIHDAGFFSLTNKRVGSTGVVGIGQTVTKQFEYGENDCPAGFVIEQGGQTFYVPLGNPVDDGESYDITLSRGKLTAKMSSPRGPPTTFVQTPSTQPLNYLR